ncbi:MAG: glycosyltransferase family 4 protein [Candidatus Pacebacteria bacterium]|nr:glycosyltransferase family 4 protein [Candidatus Paceibacterota bacterium]
MKIVFTFSHGIKYQYPGQIHFFEKHLGDKIVTAFPNYVDLDKFRNIAEEKEILIVGFPFWRKGIDIAIDAFKLIAPQYPDWKMKILGWYPDTSLLTSRIGDCSQIYHHLPVYSHEMPEQVGKCAIVCCSSRSEGVPRILMEVMMAEKPRIGSNVDGIPVVIKDGYDGLLFESGNVKQLSEKMALLMKDKELREVMGKRGRERVVKEFGSDQYFSKLTTFYNRLLV